jgi:hypothetical protein
MPAAVVDVMRWGDYGSRYMIDPLASMRPIPFFPVLMAAVATLAVASVSRQVCSEGLAWYCYSDYGPVYVTRELAGGRFPYGTPSLEYPAGLGLILWLASAIGGTAAGFARVSTVFCAGAGLAIVWLLYRHTGRRALLFAAAPTLVLYAFLNWDLLALACAIAAIAAFAARRDAACGLWLGLGAAIKVFPALLLVPMVAQRLREGDWRRSARLMAGAVLPVVALNVPIAWASWDGWMYFFRFNSERVVDWGSLWSAGCHTLGSSLCSNIPLVNTLSLVVFAAGAVLVWVLVTRAAPNIPRWQLAFPLLVVFFLSNKVYSPQYNLWILPWFALVLPSVRLFVAYEIVDIAIYVMTFGWQQRLAGDGGLPLWPLNVTLVLRAALLLVMVAAFTRRAAAASQPGPAPGQKP